jgi:localization factor PodJL
MLTKAPASAAEVTTDWLETEEPPSMPAGNIVAAADPDAAAAVEDAAPTPAAQEIAAEPAPEQKQETLAAIPENAGPAALRAAAADGDAKALFEIGNRFAQGRGVASDMAQAAQWYAKAAELGLAPAQYRLAALYEKGVGVERDIDAALTWYGKAAEQGNASAMHNLAVLHAMGADGAADNERAASWFIKAAELGVKDSQFNLGILSAKGVGMKQDLGEAYKWFALVAQGGDKDAAAKRDEVAKMLSPAELEKAQAVTELWQAKPLEPAANAVDIPEEWREDAGSTAGIDRKQAIRNIQAMLNKSGYEAGAPDGIMGQKTQAAIAAFQKDNGMEPTGSIDEPLVRALLDRS